MRIVATIQARMRSERLPGKVLLPILGRPNLELMIERLRRARHVDDVWIATTDDASCDPIEDLARRLSVGCFRGSEEDVLDRVIRTGDAAGADLIVETTGDCPLIDPPTVDLVIERFLDGGVDYCSNVITRTYPRGMDTQVFPLAVLKQVATLTSDPVDHEHVSYYIYQHPERFRLRNVESGLPAGVVELRLTLDTADDFTLIRAVYGELYPSRPDFTLSDVLALFERRPELADINRHVRQKQVR
jgi:spore coat polysaccharide biosynthesis protein SpsF